MQLGGLAPNNGPPNCGSLPLLGAKMSSRSLPDACGMPPLAGAGHCSSRAIWESARPGCSTRCATRPSARDIRFCARSDTSSRPAQGFARPRPPCSFWTMPSGPTGRALARCAQSCGAPFVAIQTRSRSSSAIADFPDPPGCPRRSPSCEISTPSRSTLPNCLTLSSTRPAPRAEAAHRTRPARPPRGRRAPATGAAPRQDRAAARRRAGARSTTTGRPAPAAHRMPARCSAARAGRAGCRRPNGRVPPPRARRSARAKRGRAIPRCRCRAAAAPPNGAPIRPSPTRKWHRVGASRCTMSPPPGPHLRRRDNARARPTDHREDEHRRPRSGQADPPAAPIIAARRVEIPERPAHAGL